MPKVALLGGMLAQELVPCPSIVSSSNALRYTVKKAARAEITKFRILVPSNFRSSRVTTNQGTNIVQNEKRKNESNLPA